MIIRSLSMYQLNVLKVLKNHRKNEVIHVTCAGSFFFFFFFLLNCSKLLKKLFFFLGEKMDGTHVLCNELFLDLSSHTQYGLKPRFGAHCAQAVSFFPFAKK